MKFKKNNTPQMKLIRNKIDIIDNKLLPLMVKRSKLVEKALELKNLQNQREFALLVTRIYIKIR